MINNKYSIDRVPTKKERIVGVVLSAIIVVVMSGLLFGATLMLISPSEGHGNALVPFVVVLLLFTASVFLFYRVAFTKKSRPRKASMFVVGVLLIVLGSIMIIAFALGANLSHYVTGSSLAVIIAGVTILSESQRGKIS